MRKVERTRAQINNYVHFFRCPVCGSDMTMEKAKSLVCANRHNFDLAKSGYINLVRRPVRTDYDQELLAARNLIAKSGFFAPMLAVASALLREHISENTRWSTAILDAGCGEGSHLSAIINQLRGELKTELIGVGVDLSKEGILIASKNNPEQIWCVADLANLPLKTEQFRVVLNILSPANYQEFSRVLNDQGLLLKVVPGSEYLIELRKVFFAGNDNKTYSNERVIRHFAKHFQLIAQQKISYRFPLAEEMLRPLLRMTPLSWHVKKEKVERVIQMGLQEVTVDFAVLLGGKSSPALQV